VTMSVHPVFGRIFWFSLLKTETNFSFEVMKETHEEFWRGAEGFVGLWSRIAHRAKYEVQLWSVKQTSPVCKRVRRIAKSDC